MWYDYKGERVWYDEIKGKLNWFSRKEILAIDPTIDLTDEKHLYDVLGEFMFKNGFRVFYNDFVFDREFENPNGWTERRYHCMVLHYHGSELTEVGIQYEYIV